MRLPEVTSTGSWFTTGRFLFILVILYYLPALLLLVGLLPFDWRFQILAVMTLVLLTYDYWQGFSLKELGFRRDTLKGALLLNAFASLLLVGLMLLAFRAGLIRTPTVPGWKLFFVYCFFISSSSQEFLYRSNVFAIMRRHNIRGPLVQIIISAVTYRFLHIFYKDPIAILATLVMGILWGAIYYRYPNFWGVALSHAVLGATAIKVGLV